MIRIILLFFLSLPVITQGQEVTINTRNCIHYKSNLLSESLIQNYSDINDSGKIIYDKTLGINVDVYIDTVFKKYSIIFLDQDNSRQVMIFTYLRNYFLDGDSNKIGSGIYLMNFAGMSFMLVDFSKVYPMRMIEIRYEKKRPNNTTLLYRVKNLERVN